LLENRITEGGSGRSKRHGSWLFNNQGSNRGEPSWLIPSPGSMANKRAPDANARVGSTSQLAPSQRVEEREAAVVSRGRGEHREKNSTCPQPTAHSPHSQQPTAHRVAFALANSSPPHFSTTIARVPCFRPLLLPLYRTRGRPPAARNVDLPAVASPFAGRPGRHAVLASCSLCSSLLNHQTTLKRPSSTVTPSSVASASSRADGTPRCLAQPWSKGAWRIGMWERSRDEERSKHTLFRILSQP
jgi:hypothetical protein